MTADELAVQRAVRRSTLQKLLDRAYSLARKLPRATTDYEVTRGLRIPMRDGVELVADLYRPLPASRGIVLVRSPYGRRAPFSNEFARLYAERGFTVLVQSCRGTFGSGGSKMPFRGEVEDGADTVEWMRRQPWFTGRFATIGVSYLGFNEWALLMDPPPEMAAAVMSSAPHNLGRIFNDRGVLAVEMALGFSDAVSHQEQDGFFGGLRRGRSAKRRHAPVLTALPLAGAEATILGDGAPWYREWMSHPDPADPYWQVGNFDEALQRAAIPVLLQGGWQDLFLEETLEGYRQLSDRGVATAVTIGPWSHPDTLGVASSSLSNESLGWLAEHLAGDGHGDRDPRRPVRIHVGGADEWRDLESWPPPAAPQTLFLGGGGRLSTETQDAGDAMTTFTYDPSDPTPSVGGATLAQNPGVKDNSVLEQRPDVITFTTDPLPADIDVVGIPRVRLFHDTDNPYVDLMVRICDVDAQGRSFNTAERYLRLDPEVSSGELELTLRPLAHRFAAGHRVRLQISGGAFPRFMRNLGTADRPGEGTVLVPSHRTVRHDRLHRSSLTLPVTHTLGSGERDSARVDP